MAKRASRWRTLESLAGAALTPRRLSRAARGLRSALGFRVPTADTPPLHTTANGPLEKDHVQRTASG